MNKLRNSLVFVNKYFLKEMKTMRTYINWYRHDIRHNWNASHWNRLCGYLIMILFGLNIISITLLLKISS